MTTRYIPGLAACTAGIIGSLSFIYFLEASGVALELPVLARLLFWLPPLLLILLFAALALNDKKGKDRGSWLVGAFMALALSGVTFFLLPPQYRVQWDESTIYSTSLSMRYSQSALIPTMSVPGEKAITPVKFSLDRRPPLFPFFVSLVHRLAGTNFINPFVVNFCALVLLLFLVFVRFSEGFGVWSGVSAQLLLVSCPLLAWLATSASTDLLSSVLLFSLVTCAANSWRAGTSSSFFLFLCVGLLSSYTRYEGVVVFSAMLAPLLWKFRAQLKVSSLYFSIAGFVLPLFLVPILLHIRLGSGSFLESADPSPFRLANVPANLWVLASRILHPFSPPYNALVNLVGVAGFVLAWRKKLLSAGVALALLPMGICLVLALGWFDGSPTDAESGRLYLFPALLLSLAPLLWLRICSSEKARRIFFGFSLLACALGIFQFSRRPVLPETEDRRFSEELDEFFASFTDEQRVRTLVITDEAFFAVSRNVAAVEPRYFLDQAKELVKTREKGFWKEAIWIRSRRDNPYQDAPAIRETLSKSYRWEEVKRIEGPAPVVFYRLKDLN